MEDFAYTPNAAVPDTLEGELENFMDDFVPDAEFSTPHVPDTLEVKLENFMDEFVPDAVTRKRFLVELVMWLSYRNVCAGLQCEERTYGKMGKYGGIAQDFIILGERFSWSLRARQQKKVFGTLVLQKYFCSYGVTAEEGEGEGEGEAERFQPIAETEAAE